MLMRCIETCWVLLILSACVSGCLPRDCLQPTMGDNSKRKQTKTTPTPTPRGVRSLRCVEISRVRFQYREIKAPSPELYARIQCDHNAVLRTIKAIAQLFKMKEYNESIPPAHITGYTCVLYYNKDNDVMTEIRGCYYDKVLFGNVRDSYNEMHCAKCMVDECNQHLYITSATMDVDSVLWAPKYNQSELDQYLLDNPRAYNNKDFAKYQVRQVELRRPSIKTIEAGRRWFERPPTGDGVVVTTTTTEKLTTTTIGPSHKNATIADIFATVRQCSGSTL